MIDILSNLKWDLIFYFKFIFYAEFRKMMNSNKKFKNLHLNKRCFIIGNGPSLNELDLKKLKNEFTFSVNNIMQNKKIYETINTDYHVLIDPLYFSLNPDIHEDKATIDLLKSINYNDKKPFCFTSYKGNYAFERYGLKACLDLAYIYQHKKMSNSFSRKINLCRNIPSSQNVVQSAIFVAIYMGFKEIYLIGCDMTSIFLTYEANKNGEKEILKDYHAYNYSESEKKTMLRDFSNLDNEFMLYDYAYTFTIFKQIQKYALKQNIVIKNATVGGGLDVFHRINFETLFPKNI